MSENTALADCPKINCGYSAEGRTAKEAEARLRRHLSREDHLAALRHHLKTAH